MSVLQLESLSDVDEFLIAYNSIDEDEQAYLLMISPYETVEEARAHLQVLQQEAL
jgi:hypothetical protein